MDSFQEHTHRQSTIVNIVRRLCPEAVADNLEVGHQVNSSFGSDQITLSAEAHGEVCLNERRQMEWLRANKGRKSSVTASQVYLYRPSTMLLSGRPNSAHCFSALSLAAGRLA